MPTSPVQDRFASKELFRYVKVRRPRVIDFRLRARQAESVKTVLDLTPQARLAWAGDFLRSPRLVRSPADLQFDYLAHLKPDALSSPFLPTRAHLRDPDAFPAARIRADADFRADHEACLLTALAFHLAGGDGRRDEGSREAARLLDFVETFPDLRKVKHPRRPAPILLERKTRRVPKPPQPQPIPPAPGEGSGGQEEAAPEEELRTLSKDLLILWKARNRLLREREEAYDRAYRDLIRPRRRDGDVGGAAPGLPAENPSRQARQPRLARKAAPGGRGADDRKAAAQEYAGSLRERLDRLRDLKREDGKAREESGLYALLRGDASELARHATGLSRDEVEALLRRLRELLGRHDIRTESFCQAYELAAEKADAAAAPEGVKQPGGGCFGEYPGLVFADAVRILGRGELVRVDETFVKYSAGEISYVENVLAGESRKREVKSAKLFEQTSETVTEEEEDSSRETGVATKQELGSQIETELRTRFDSDINASVGASGGGTLGVVDLQGGANLDASLGLGVDTGLSTSSESSFSQEIVAKAMERTRKSALERRTTRTSVLYETLDHHGIENTAPDASHRNGVYCFLDRHVAITETVYGQRLFVLANILLPGESLLCAAGIRARASMEELGARPVFDLSPEDVTPANYRQLAGRHKAANVEPPPSPTSALARTYKTDATNALAESQEIGFKKVADVLVPFFARYKRYMVIENLRIPEGYEVLDVDVTVNHGGNGVSIPAHLPLSLAGGSIYLGPSMAAYSAYGPLLIPYWLWHLAYLASPMLHYNADSSLATVCVGNRSRDSRYYFFHPDFLIQEVFDLVGNLGALLPDIMGQIQESAQAMFDLLQEKAESLPGEVQTAVTGTVGTLITSLRGIFEDILHARFDDMWEKATQLTATFDITGLQNLMGEFFEPLTEFIQGVIDILDSGVGSALADLFAFFREMFDNHQELSFPEAAGARGELAFSLNVSAINPGVTVNVSACLRRTPEALDKWRLRTYSALYQGHLQLLADWENRNLMAARAARDARPAALLREEEHAALKGRILHALNNEGAPNGNAYTLERMNFFEHAFDWRNMSYRVFNYGPGREQLKIEKLPAFSAADPRRRAFLTGLWAQALVPVRADARLEDQVFRWFDNGTFEFEGDLEDEELVALYQDMVLERESSEGTAGEPVFAVLPTGFVVVKTADLDAQLPRNDAFAEAGP